MRREKLQHFQITASDRNPYCVGRAFNRRIRIRTTLQQQAGDFMMTVVNGGVERVAQWCDSFLRKIWISPPVEQQFHDVHMTCGRSILERRAAAGIVRVVLIDPVYQRWVLV